MLFQVTEIEFDFSDNDDETITSEVQNEIEDEVVGQIWEADDENDLIEEIVCAYGWTINSLNYRYILK